MNRIKKVSTSKKPNVPFSQAEDDIIRVFVAQHGSGDFGLIKYYLPHRTPRQVRERWRLYLNPMINNVPFTIEDDKLLIEKYTECKGS
jgi:hypothetical protein